MLFFKQFQCTVKQLKMLFLQHWSAYPQISKHFQRAKRLSHSQINPTEIIALLKVVNKLNKAYLAIQKEKPVVPCGALWSATQCESLVLQTVLWHLGLQ